MEEHSCPTLPQNKIQDTLHRCERVCVCVKCPVKPKNFISNTVMLGFWLW